jgi:hypothetical protein
MCAPGAARTVKNPLPRTPNKVHASIAALLVFFALNATLTKLYQTARTWQSQPYWPTDKWCKPLHIKLWDEAAIDSAINGFHLLSKKPRVVLMGSSVMMLPFWKVDKAIDPSLPTKMWMYHHSEGLQKALGGLGVSEPTVYNLATPLQMISDSYLYVNNVISGSTQPQVVVLGVTPREFYDHDFPTPGKTLYFSCCVGLSNCPPARLYLPNWQDLADFYVSRLFFLYDKRSFIVNGIQASAVKWGKKTETMPQSDRTLFSIDQYKRRYRGIDVDKLEEQSQFLTRLARDCRQHHIQLVVVNMPIPSANRALFPTGFYDSYRAKVGAAAAGGSAQFVDLADCSEFNSSDFSDSIHLNAIGGTKLIKRLSTTVAQALDTASG